MYTHCIRQVELIFRCNNLRETHSKRYTQVQSKRANQVCLQGPKSVFLLIQAYISLVQHYHHSWANSCGIFWLLTLGAHAQRWLQFLVCVSVTQHLTFHVFIHATNDTNLLSGGWRSKVLSDFFWKCFVVKLEHFLLVRLHDKSAILYSAENAHAYESGPRD